MVPGRNFRNSAIFKDKRTLTKRLDLKLAKLLLRKKTI